MKNLLATGDFLLSADSYTPLIDAHFPACYDYSNDVGTLISRVLIMRI